MSFQGVDPARLFQTLNNTGLQNKDNPLYQLLFNMIGILSRLTILSRGITNSSGVSTVVNNINNIIQQISLDGGSGGSEDGNMGPPGLMGIQGISGVNGMVPYYIASTEVFTIPLYKQALFSMNIDNEGILDIEGYLIEVD